MPYGYLVGSGYKGVVDDKGTEMMFPTEQEYIDYISQKGEE